MATRDHKQLKPFVKGDPRINRNGRPKKSERLDNIFDKALSDDDIEGILNSIKRKAKDGDVKAAEMLFDRYFGKPIARNAMTDTEGNDVDISERPVIIIGTPEEVKDSINRLNDNIE